MENDALNIDNKIDSQEAKRWLSRAKTASKHHTRELLPKYNTAKRRYNSEIGKKKNVRRSLTTTMSHTDVNLLYGDVRSFISSIFHKNPRIDLTADNDEDRYNVENLEQKVNDDIRDDDELKGIIRSTLVDESLASIGAVYIDYYYDGEVEYDEFGQEVAVSGENQIKVCKITPENIIRPPWIKQYNWKSSPYLGYVDIVTLESLKEDRSLDQEEVKKLKGAEYKELVDREVEDNDDGSESKNDDVLHVKCYYLFIRKTEKAPLIRLVIADEQGGVVISNQAWDKGHKNFPIHILMLNEAADSFLPPSEAWILETILQVIDYLFEKMNKHLRKSTNRIFVKTGKGGLDKEEIEKIAKNINKEIVGIDGLPGVDIRSLVTEIVSNPLAGDHGSMLDLAMRLFDDMSRQPAFARPDVIHKKKTATETQAIMQEDNTENGDYVDKFRDFLKDLFLDWCYLTQMNYQGVIDSLDVQTDDGIDKRKLITRENMQGKFKGSIRIESFQEPNKAVKRRIIKETIADSQMLMPGLQQQGKTLNWTKLTEQYFENVDIRDSEELIVDAPQRSVDQQVQQFVSQGVAMNPQEVGGDVMQAVQRSMEIFQDEELMALYEAKTPGIGEMLGEFIINLNQMSGQSKPPQRESRANTDMQMNAQEMSSGAEG